MVLARNTQVQFQPVARTGRRIRAPEHPFQLRHPAFTITPFHIQPVLPGETLKSLKWQSRVVSDPIKNPLIGWWIEYYFFYVKHRDLDDRELMESMVLVQGTAMTSIHDALSEQHYHGSETSGSATASPDWLGKCVKRITEEYFREEGETQTSGAFLNVKIDAVNDGGGGYQCGINRKSWLDSVKDQTTTPGESYPAGADPDIWDTGVPSEFSSHYTQWQYMRELNLIDMDYNQFLRTYGVKLPREKEVEEHRPELLRYVRKWSYPTNTVEPTTGTPSSALSWGIAESIDKDRFFPEPGFIVGVTVARPKVYFSGQGSKAVDMLTDAYSWLPAVLRDEPYTSLKNFAAGFGPLANVVYGAGKTGGTDTTNGYWVDIKDLFLYGDQFLNFGVAATDAGFVALPTAALGKRFITQTDHNGLFSSATYNRVRQDGTVFSAIAGSIHETT